VPADQAQQLQRTVETGTPQGAHLRMPSAMPALHEGCTTMQAESIV
jgi:hypothetical protein